MNSALYEKLEAVSVEISNIHADVCKLSKALEVAKKRLNLEQSKLSAIISVIEPTEPTEAK